MRGLKASLATLIILAAIPAAAQTSQRLQQFSAWGTFSYKNQNEGTVCYVLSVPETKEPNSLDHGDIYFIVSMKPGQNVSYEPQFVTSYTMKENSKVTVNTGDKDFTMFVQGKYAWLENAAEEPQLIAAMRAGANMQVSAVSGRGNSTKYSFSLKGVTAALKSISECK